MSVQIAFYIGNESWIDSVIKWRTSSITSHVEMIVDGMFYSSSPHDGGVRTKRAHLGNHRNWVVFSLPEKYKNATMDLYCKTRKAKYDWVSAVIGQGLAVKIRNSNEWFCSEWCAEVLGFKESWRYSPAMLLDIIKSGVFNGS